MNIIYMINYYVFNGLTAWGFHLVNILFHVGVTILVFSISSLFFPDVEAPLGPLLSAPLLSALIFAVHPVHSEVVAWVACVPELSFTFFGLLAFYFHMRSRQNSDRAHMWSVVFFASAIFCKETAVTLLPLLAVYDYLYRIEQRDIRRILIRYIPFVIITGLYALIRFHALGGVAPSRAHPELTAYEEILNIFPLFSHYLGKLLVPINLNAVHVLHPVHSIADLNWLGSLAVVSVFAVSSWVSFKKNKTVFFGLMLIIIPLLPAFYIRGLGQNTFAERYLYLPSVGFSLLAGSLVTSEKINSARLKMPLLVFSFSVLMLYSLGTIQRNNIWRTQLSLWADTVQKSPDSAPVRNNLGLALYAGGETDAAIRKFQEALTLNYKYPEAHCNLGFALLNKGAIDAAIKEFQEVLKISPNYYEAHNNMGLAFANLGQIDAAIKEFQEVLKINPNYYEAHYNLGLAYYNKGDVDAAIKQFREALIIEPDDRDARANLEMALEQKGRYDNTRK